MMPVEFHFASNVSNKNNLLKSKGTHLSPEGSRSRLEKWCSVVNDELSEAPLEILRKQELIPRARELYLLWGTPGILRVGEQVAPAAIIVISKAGSKFELTMSPGVLSALQIFQQRVLPRHQSVNLTTQSIWILGPNLHHCPMLHSCQLQHLDALH
jgi:hypothetical protein